MLDIQALVDRAYRYGRYECTDYSADLDSPLQSEDASWINAILRESGLR